MNKFYVVYFTDKLDNNSFATVGRKIYMQRHGSLMIFKEEEAAKALAEKQQLTFGNTYKHEEIIIE